MTEIAKPRNVFISYAWEDDTRMWVRELATRLRSHGIETILDQWDIAPGDSLPEFMENSVSASDFVLIVCTPAYKKKSDSSDPSGVGYEKGVITGELFVKRNQRKFIPLLRKGTWLDAAPSWVLGKNYIDLRGKSYSEDNYQELLRTIYGKRTSPPPLGAPPDFSGDAGESESTRKIAQEKAEREKVETLPQVAVAQSFPAPGSRAEGITWDGTSLWVSDNSGVIFKVDASGNVRDSVRSPDVTPQGLTWDGSSLWVYTTNRSLIYQIQVVDGNVRAMNSFRSPAEVVGGGITQDMAWDGESLWYANQYKVYQLDSSGSVLSSFTFPKNVTGLGWDGSNLWIAYNDFPAKASLNMASTHGNVLKTFISPILEINSLAWADGYLWALGLDSMGGTPMIYRLEVPEKNF